MDGPLSIEKKLAKSKYKNYIKKKKKDSEDKLSERFHNFLLERDQKSFWKVWKSNFKKNKNSLHIIKSDIANDNISDANRFVKYFATISNSNTCTQNYDIQNKCLIDKIKDYVGDWNMFESLVDSNCIHRIILGMK